MNHSYIESKIGGRSENQDSYGSYKTKNEELIIICDGMGGHLGGRIASELAVSTIIEELNITTGPISVISLRHAIEKANIRIWEEAKLNYNYRNMGTTIVTLLITPEKAVSCHVGDSRLYQFRNGEIIHRTKDHSLVYELIDAGLLTEEEARVSPRSNIITRALGIKPSVDIEITDNLFYQKGDRFLLCTDGVWGALPMDLLINQTTKNGDIKQVILELIERIDNIGIKCGGNHDNLTAAILEIDY